MRLRQPAVLPYLPLAPDAVEAEPWTTQRGDALPERLIDWDPATDLHLFRDLELRPSLVRERCRLEPHSRIAVIPIARSDRTRIRIAGEKIVLSTEDDAAKVTLGMHLKGQALGGVLSLRTVIVSLDRALTEPLAPKLSGSQLWADEIRCDLEGSSPRFPVSAVRFSEFATLEPKAAWTLDWEPADLAEPLLGAVRLLVNAEKPAIAAAVVSGSDAPAHEVIRAAIQHDVARRLIRTALASPDFVEDPAQYPDGSVGRAIADLIELHWGEDVAILAARARDHDRRFEMELQVRFPVLPEAA